MGECRNVGIIVSQFIGAKVFLNYVCTLFNYAPTKMSLFLVISDENQNQDVIEIKTKGNISSKLIDLGITNNSEVLLV